MPKPIIMTDHGLRLCPFCKSDNLERCTEEGYKLVSCNDCDCFALENVWNNRPLEDELRKGVKP